VDACTVGGVGRVKGGTEITNRGILDVSAADAESSQALIALPQKIDCRPVASALVRVEPFRAISASIETSELIL
jgi:hypothetical protein